VTSAPWLSWLEQLWAYPLVLLAVVLAARLLPLPAIYHPLTVFRFFAQQLGKKVNPEPDRPRQQLYISGTLALLVALLPTMALLYSLYQFSELPLILDALLLFCSLDWRAQQQHAQLIQHSLQRGQLTLAREQASTLVLRRTSALTAMGLSKAILESLVLRFASQFIAVLCWFLLGGGLAALAYRLALELAQQWNTKLDAYRYFGRPTAWLINILSAPPKLVVCSLLALQYGIARCYRQCQQPRQNISRFSFWLLACFSVALRRNMGGPLYYSDLKQQRSKLVQAHEPAATDIITAVKTLQFSKVFFLLLVLSSSLLHLAWLLAR